MSKAKGIPYNPPTRGKMKLPAIVPSRTKRNFAKIIFPFRNILA